MKLLEEGFDLCAHLLALRRYHFMEISDWADSFIAQFILRSKVMM
jgi:gamma-tubulin complex component 6